MNPIPNSNSKNADVALACGPDRSSAPQFTPGPWTFEAATLYTVGGDTCPGWHITDHGIYRVGCVGNVNDSPQNAANARLIASAPALYEALDDVLKWLAATPDGYETVPPDSVARARAALAGVSHNPTA